MPVSLGRHTLTVGDCVEGMAALADCSVDAVVTDPPYLIGFMSKQWDKAADPIAWHRRWLKEALRVLKPGGHLIAFSATRAVHWLACAAEFEGFELRDTIHWCYWSGFPKSLDVGKAIDGCDAVALTTERALEFTAWLRSTGITSAQVNEATGSFMASHYLTAKSQPAVATPAHMDAIRPVLAGLGAEVPAWVDVMCGCRRVGLANLLAREVLGEGVSGFAGGSGEHAGTANAYGFAGEYDITTPATPDAHRWNGWGTALKPAVEPAILARKPLNGTVAATVLEYGTGAINVDACRFPYGDSMWPGPNDDSERGRNNAAVVSWRAGESTFAMRSRTAAEFSGGGGRYPANLVYCPKPSTAEREAGCEGLRQASAGELTGGRAEGSAGLTPRAGAGRTASARGNHHPTVKPLRLMRWLVRLVTPPGGTVLEPFCGSGTTLVGADLEGFRCIAFERTPEYEPIIRARYSARERLRLISDGKPSDPRSVEVASRQVDLFGGPA